MKKILTMMLVLLIVGGAVFGDDPTGSGFDSEQGVSSPVVLPVDTQLTIQANATGFFKHGFSNTEADSFGEIVANTLYTDVYRTIDLTSSDAQTLAYYQIATNTRNDFSVTLTATPLRSQQYIDLNIGTELEPEYVYFYVPYTLGYGSSTVNVGVGGGSTGTPTTTNPGSGNVTLFGSGSGEPDWLDGNTNGILAAQYKLTLTLPELAGTGEVALPEGNYEGTITVAIAAE